MRVGWIGRVRGRDVSLALARRAARVGGGIGCRVSPAASLRIVASSPTGRLGTPLAESDARSTCAPSYPVRAPVRPDRLWRCVHTRGRPGGQPSVEPTADPTRDGECRRLRPARGSRVPRWLRELAVVETRSGGCVAMGTVFLGLWGTAWIHAGCASLPSASLAAPVRWRSPHAEACHT